MYMFVKWSETSLVKGWCLNLPMHFQTLIVLLHACTCMHMYTNHATSTRLIPLLSTLHVHVLVSPTLFLKGSRVQWWPFCGKLHILLFWQAGESSSWSSLVKYCGAVCRTSSYGTKCKWYIYMYIIYMYSVHVVSLLVPTCITSVASYWYLSHWYLHNMYISCTSVLVPIV